MKPSTFTPTSPATTASPPWSPRLWGLLFVLAGNMLIDALEVSVAIVALPSIGTDLRLPLTVVQWTMSGFALGFGGLMLFGARVVALLGRRRVYLVALLAFAAASVVGGLTSTPELLVATRFVKGFCAALTAPTGLAIIGTTFRQGPERGRALSVYTLFGASGFTAGLLLSGLLTQISWRWTFLFPAPVVLVLFAFALRLIPGDEPDAVMPRRFGVAAAVSFTAALLAVVYGIVSVPAHGWRDPRVTGSLAFAVLLLAVFVLVERGSPRPLVRASVRADDALLRSALGAATLNGSYLGLLLIATVQLQTVLGWSPLRAALAFVPASAPLAVTALLSGRMVDRFGTARLIALGALAPPLGYVLYLRLPAHTSYATDVLPTMLLVGVGFVLAFAALNAQAVSGVSPADRPAASGLYQTAVQIGAAVTLALTAALLTAGQPPAGASTAEVMAGYRPAVWLVTGIGLVGLLVALTGVLPRRRTAAPQPSGEKGTT